MRFVLSCCIFLALAVVGLGVYLVLQQQRRVLSFSAPTTATVLAKRVEDHVHREAKTYHTYEPVVEYRYQVGGRQFTSDRVFPVPQSDIHFSPNAARRYWELLEPFEVGDETTAWYIAGDPAEACLLRRPSYLPYFVILLPVMLASGLVAIFWPASPRRKGFWIAVAWHTAGSASAVHYFVLAGEHYAGAAMVSIGVYTQLGLIPLACALPSSESSDFARRIKLAVGCSLFGSFAGIWLGWLAGWLAVAVSDLQSVRGHWIGYGMAVSAALFALLGLTSGPPDKRNGSRRRGTKTPSQDRSHQAESAAEVEHVAYPPPSGPVPYQIDRRPMPGGERLETLLPGQVGPFRRATLDEPDDVRNTPIYATYRSGSVKIFVELGICDDPAGAQRALATAKAETDAEFPDAPQQFSANTEPSFLHTRTPLGAFFAWTRGHYYFSAHARSGQQDLDRFLEAFPY